MCNVIIIIVINIFIIITWKKLSYFRDLSVVVFKVLRSTSLITLESVLQSNFIEYVIAFQISPPKLFFDGLVSHVEIFEDPSNVPIQAGQCVIWGQQTEFSASLVGIERRSSIMLKNWNLSLIAYIQHSRCGWGITSMNNDWGTQI